MQTEAHIQPRGRGLPGSSRGVAADIDLWLFPLAWHVRLTMFLRSFGGIQVQGTVRFDSGILPDAMHLAHLAIFPDVYISVLLDLTDDYPKRDSKLTELYENYRLWCESQSN